MKLYLNNVGLKLKILYKLLWTLKARPNTFFNIIIISFILQLSRHFPKHMFKNVQAAWKSRTVTQGNGSEYIILVTVIATFSLLFIKNIDIL